MIDHFCDRPEFPHLRKFFSGSRSFTTMAEEEGELSPWITWPSLHRGMNGGEHQVRFLGQDPKTFMGTPIWEEYRRRGESIGICGSLQSWPPLDPGPGGFYIPDTFARDPRCVPTSVSGFQAINLRLTGENGRVVRSSLPLREIFRAALAAPLWGIRPATVLAVFHQLILERLDSARIARRPVFQARLQWDIFKKLYRGKNPPPYAAFFTNHSANIMHRYWSHVFPEDFPENNRPQDHAHAATMDYAMATIDGILAEAMALQEKNPELILAFATSMGQQAVLWKGYEGISTIVTDAARLIGALCPEIAPSLFSQSLAMVPQITVDISDSIQRARLKSALETAQTASGARLFFFEEKGTQLSISIRTPASLDVQAGGFHAGTEKKFLSWSHAGIEVARPGPASAYHIPEGVLALYGAGITSDNDRARLPLRQVKSLLLEISGLGTQITSQCSPGEIQSGVSARPVEASVTS